MISKLFNLIFKLIICLLVLGLAGFILMGVWIVYDGTHDDYDHADVALVPANMEIKESVLSPNLVARLDRAAVLYKDGKFPFIVVSGVTPPGEDDETEAMAKYLEGRNVPADAIIQDHRGEHASDTVDNIVGIMKAQKFHSLLLIPDYYKLTRLKLVLGHKGVREFEQAHSGEWKKEDNLDVLHEDIAIYKDLYTWYAAPTMSQVQVQAQEEEATIKDKVDDGLSSLHSKQAH